MLPKQPNQSLIDGMRCLQAVLTQNKPAGASDMVRGLGIELTRAHRLLKTLAHMGFLQQGAGRKYVTGPAFTILAAQAMHGSPLLAKALPALEALRKETPHIVAMGVLWMRSVSYIYHARPKTKIENAIGGQEVWEAHESGLGMALLAQQDVAAIQGLYGKEARALSKELKPIREAGHAFIPTVTGMHTLALPLPGYTGVAIGLSGKISARDSERLLPLLTASAERIVAAK